jgi:hypothetical protein
MGVTDSELDMRHFLGIAEISICLKDSMLFSIAKSVNNP